MLGKIGLFINLNRRLPNSSLVTQIVHATVLPKIILIINGAIQAFTSRITRGLSPSACLNNINIIVSC